MDNVQFATLVAFVCNLGARFEEGDVRRFNEMVKPLNPNGNVTALMNAMIHNRKIEAIKELRTMTGLGLKESKDMVEAAMSQTPYQAY